MFLLPCPVLLPAPAPAPTRIMHQSGDFWRSFPRSQTSVVVFAQQPQPRGAARPVPQRGCQLLLQQRSHCPPSTEQPGCRQASTASSSQPPWNNPGGTAGPTRATACCVRHLLALLPPQRGCCSRAGSCCRFPHLKPPTALDQTVLMRSSRCQKPPGEQTGLRDSSLAKLLP